MAQAMPAAGQGEGQKATIFGGYSFLRNAGNNSQGFDGQATFNFNRYLGLTADIGGNALTTGLSTSTGGAQNFYRYSGGIVFRF